MSTGSVGQIYVVREGNQLRMQVGGIPEQQQYWPISSGGLGSAARKARAVKLAIAVAQREGDITSILLPGQLLGYDASLVTFDDDIRMIREGQVLDVSDVMAYGAAGDGSTNDRVALQAAIDHAASGSIGRVMLSPNHSYLVTLTESVTNLGVIVKDGVTLDLNGATINLACTGGVYGVRLADNAHVKGPGTIAVTASASPGSQGIWHTPVSIGDAYSSGGTVASPSEFHFVSGWSVRDLTLTNVRPGGVLVSMIGGVHDGLIENIIGPTNATTRVAIAADWGFVGDPTFSTTDSLIGASRAMFDGGTVYTTHPHDIKISNISLGTWTYSAGSDPLEQKCIAVRLSGCYNITTENVYADQLNGVGYFVAAGDVGFEFAPVAQKQYRARGIIFRNGFFPDMENGNLCYMDSNADNVQRAVGSYAYTALLTPLYRNDYVVENLRGFSDGGASVARGFYLTYMDGGTIQNCTASGFLYGVNCDEAAHRVKIIGGEYYANRGHGIYIAHSTTKPEDVVVDGARCYGNGTGSVATWGGVTTGAALRPVVRNCILGEVSEASQYAGVRIDSSTTDAVVERCHVIAHDTSGKAYMMGSSAGFGAVKLFRDCTATAGITFLDSNSEIPLVVELRETATGYIKVMVGTAAPASGTWIAGDRVEYQAPTAGGFMGAVCTTGGTPGTWKTFGAVSA